MSLKSRIKDNRVGVLRRIISTTISRIEGGKEEKNKALEKEENNTPAFHENRKKRVKDENRRA
jgi:hypothetical protein